MGDGPTRNMLSHVELIFQIGAWQMPKLVMDFTRPILVAAPATPTCGKEAKT